MTFARELAFARKYLDIQRIRFEGLEVEWAIAHECESLRVPSLLLQPLIENAVHHGVCAGRPRNFVRVTSAKQGPQLIVEIVNSASRVNTDHEGFGVGLKNVVERLERLYGQKKYDLDLDLIQGEDGEELMRLRMALPIDKEVRRDHG